MMKLITCYLLPGLLLTAQACSDPAGEEPEGLKLWYDRPAEAWVEALPIGNGRLGGMIFGGVEKERIQFNEETLWTGRPRDYQREGAAKYLPRIRELLFQGKQEEAEELAGREFMGTLLNEENYEELRAEWLDGLRSLEGMNGDPSLPAYDDGGWEEMELPAQDGWRSAGLEGLNGAVWFRKEFELPETWTGGNLVLELGRIRDQDFTYVNGRKAGSVNGKDLERRYLIPAESLQPGKNTIAVQVISYFDKGGFTGFSRRGGPMAIYPEGGPKEAGISLNGAWKYKVQDALPPEFPDYMARYQPFGDLEIRFRHAGDVSGYRRELDISRAVARTTYESGGVTYTREYFSSAPGGVIAVHLSASEPGKISFEASLSTPHALSEVRRVDDHTLGLSFRIRDGALEGSSYLRAELSGGELNVSGDRIRIREADQATLYLAAGTNFINYKDTSGDPEAICRQILGALEGKEYSDIRAGHIRDYRDYFDTFSIDLGKSAGDSLPTDERLKKFGDGGDPALAALYLQYGRYLLISSSRPGTQPANLQGIWNDLMLPPWDSKYTTNINVEMNYWPAELLNLPACHEPLFRMIEDLAKTGKETARAHYGCRGWVLHHNTDLWRGTAPVNASNHGIWVGGGAWLCHHLWEHYLFTLDRDFLEKRAYPLMKEAALFYVDFLVEDPRTGWLISTPSNSPELGGLVAGPTMDHQLIRDLFGNCIQASELLGADEAFRAVLKEKMERIAPNQIGKHGQLQEWLEDKDDPEEKHRHASHMWGVFPGHDITWQTPELMKAARQSLLYRGDGGTGWSLAWKINLWARFRDGDHAFRMIGNLLQPAVDASGRERGGTYPNLFDAHPPFQIDGNFGGAAGIGEMLLQSHEGYLDLLPALPAAWPEGSVKGICARGGFVLDFNWKDGRLQELELTARRDGACRLRYGEKEVRFETVAGERYRFNSNLEQQ